MSLPYDHAAESAVIGCLFGSADAVRWAADWLTPGDFLVPSHAAAFAAAIGLYREGGRVDLVTMADRMRRDKTFRDTTMSDLNTALSDAPSVSRITDYGGIVTAIHHFVDSGARPNLVDRPNGMRGESSLIFSVETKGEYAHAVRVLAETPDANELLPVPR